MKGLLIKDWYVLWKNARFSMLIAAVFILLPLVTDIDFGSTVNYLTVFPFLFVGTLPVNLISYDEMYKWDSFAAAMPYTRGQLVSVKYLGSLILNLFVYCLMLLVTAVKARMSGSSAVGEIILNTGMFLSFGIFMPSFIFPIIYKVGVQKSRLVYIIVYLFFYFLFSNLIGQGVVDYLSRISLSVPVIIALICAVMAGLYALSWALSVKIYKQHEF